MKTKTRIATVVTAAALALGATACTPERSTPQTPAQDRQATYLKLVHENTASKADDGTLVRLAEASCAAMRSGATFSDLGREVIAAGGTRSTREDTYKVIGYGLSQYCPEVAK